MTAASDAHPCAMPTALTLDDIVDLRAYERGRDEFRRQVVARKRVRRVALGPVMTLVFESVDTVRFQVQEMARAERIATDAGIQAELDVYNRLLPRPGELSATVFIELTSEAELRQWLPALVGIERSLGLEVPSGSGTTVVRGEPEAEHQDALTREEVTAAVHYVRFAFAPDQVAAFAVGPVALVADHPAYQERTALSEETRQALLADLEGRTQPLQLG